MCFTWISAAMLCCPALWTEQEPTFDKYAYICVPNWQHMAAYSTTLGSSNILILLFIKLHFFLLLAALVLGPSLISLFYNYGYIFSMMRKLRSGVPIHDKEWELNLHFWSILTAFFRYATALAENLSNPSHVMSFLLVLLFFVSWLPYIG